MEFYEHKLRAITALCVINLVIGVILIVLFGLAVKRISDFFDKMTQESFQAILIQVWSLPSVWHQVLLIIRAILTAANIFRSS